MDYLLVFRSSGITSHHKKKQFDFNAIQLGLGLGFCTAEARQPEIVMIADGAWGRMHDGGASAEEHWASSMGAE